LPLPNGPGTAATPPRAIGKNVSITRWPVTIGSLGGSFSRYGRPLRTGHFCTIVSGTSPLGVSRIATTSSIVKPPDRISFTVPRMFGGTMILWTTTAVSCTVPRRLPPETGSPTFAVGSNIHFLSRSKALASTPRMMRSPVFARIAVSGRCMPSKIDSISPGPNSTDSGAPVE